MDQKTQVLRAFITQSLQEFGYVPDEQVFKVIEDHVTLSERPGSEYEETRSANIKEDSSGKITAELFSLYNLSRVSFYDLFGVLLDEAGILLMADDTRLKILLALAKMIYSFIPKLTYKLNEIDAKIMLAIYYTKKSPFKINDVAESFERQFNTVIDEPQLQRSLDFLVKIDFLKISDGKYTPKQRMNYERD